MRYTTTRPAERLRRSVVSRYQGNPERLSPAHSCGEGGSAQNQDHQAHPGSLWPVTSPAVSTTNVPTTKPPMGLE
jgi:hypothetical protein